MGSGTKTRITVAGLKRNVGIGLVLLISFVLTDAARSARAAGDPHGTAKTDATLEADLQRILERVLADNTDAPGLSVYVECPPLDLRWAGAAGTIAHGSDTPLSPTHTFRIASNTKSYVAAAVLRLVELGKLGLDDPLGKHLSSHHHGLLAGDGYDLDAMTIRQVLNHTSGLHQHCHDSRYAEAIMADPWHRWTRDEQIELCVRWSDPLGAPGERYAYSDTGYIILGGIIEQLTGKGLAAAVRELLDFERLGLRATWWEILESCPDSAGPRAHQYYGEFDTNGWDASQDLYGGGGLISDSPELAGFMRQLLTGQVLARETSLAAMTGSGTPPYRLGLMVLELGGHLAWGHQGFWNTFAFHVPILDLTVAGAILNHHAVNGKELARELIERVAAARE